jgi:glucose uptake protein GlcU
MNLIPLVNWGMGTIIIGVFAIVCIVMSLVIYNLANSDKKQKESDN